MDKVINMEALEEAAIISDTMTDDELARRIIKAQEILESIKDVERIMRDEAAKRIRNNGGRILTPHYSLKLEENMKRDFDTAELFSLEKVVDKEVFSGAYEMKIAWKWAKLKEISKSSPEAAEIISKGVTETVQTPTLKVEVKKEEKIAAQEAA